MKFVISHNKLLLFNNIFNVTLLLKLKFHPLHNDKNLLYFVTSTKKNMQEGKKMTFNDDTYSSVAANNSHHITKQKLLKIREIYEFCKNAQQNLQVRHIVNAKFAQIVEEAEEQIKLFAEGKLNIDNDALDLMKEYIEEFGRNYYKHGGQMRYEYSPEATKAKIMLEQHRYQTTRRQGAVSAEMSETFNLDAMSRGTADEFVLPDNEILNQTRQRQPQLLCRRNIP